MAEGKPEALCVRILRSHARIRGVRAKGMQLKGYVHDEDDLHGQAPGGLPLVCG